MIDFEKIIVDPRHNEPVEYRVNDKKTIPLTLSLAVTEALGGMQKGDENDNVSERRRRGKLIDDILDKKQLDLDTEDVAMILDRVYKRYNTLIWNECRKAMLDAPKVEQVN